MNKKKFRVVPRPHRTTKLNGAIIIGVTKDISVHSSDFLKGNYLPLGPTLKVPLLLSITPSPWHVRLWDTLKSHPNGSNTLHLLLHTSNYQAAVSFILPGKPLPDTSTTVC